MSSGSDMEILDSRRRDTGDPRGETLGDDRGDLVLTRSRMQYEVQLTTTKNVTRSSARHDPCRISENLKKSW